MLPRRSRKSKAAALRWLPLLLLLCWCANSHATVLWLRNGDRLTGTILSEDARQVILRTVWHNVVVVPVADIKSREETAPVPASPSVPSGQTPTPVVPGTAPVTPLTTSAPPAPPPSLHKFTGEAQVGTDLLFSEKKRQLVSGRLKLGYTFDKLRNLLDYTFTYGHTEGVLSDNRMFGSLKSDYDLPGRSYVYSMAGAGFDEIREIAFRYELGPGYGYHLIKTTNLVLNAEVGANYQAQYLTDETIENFYFRFAEDGMWKIHPRLTLDQRFEYFPQMDNWGRYRLRAEGNLRYALKSNLALVVTVLDEYDAVTAEGVGRNDLQIRSSLSVKF